MRADRVMMVVAWLLWGCALGFACLHHEWVAALAVGTPLTLLVTALARWMPGRLTTRLVVAAVFMGMSGLLIHEAHGVIETHFSIFALLAFLLYYRDWRPIVFAAAVIGLHHTVACRLQMAGSRIFVFSMEHGCEMVYVHVAYVLVETFVLVYLARAIRMEALESAAISGFARYVMESGVIDLRGTPEGMLRSASLDRLLEALHKVVRQNLSAAGSITEAAENVTTTAGEILIAGKTQQTSSHNAVATVRKMVGTAEEVKRHSIAIAEVARSSTRMVAEGQSIMKQTGDSMGKLVEATFNVTKEVDGLHADSTQIEGIIRMMTDIARQTELLALNASIEAAVAGDAARGFNVIAQEVRGLSMATHVALEKAQRLVDQMHEQTRRVASMTQFCCSEAQKSGLQVSLASEKLDQVVQELPQIARRSTEMAEHVGQYNELSETAVAAMSEVGKAIQNNACSLERLGSLGRMLEHMSGEMMDGTKVFRVRAA